ACANVASLFFSRLTSLQRDIAVRRALGATRFRVVTQFLLESLVFCSIAAVLGTILSAWAILPVQSMVNNQLALNAELTLNWRALIVTTGIAIMSAFLVGLTPAIHASHTDLIVGLKDSGRGSSGRARYFRSALIVGEVTLSVVLLIGSALLILSFLKLQSTPP